MSGYIDQLEKELEQFQRFKMVVQTMRVHQQQYFQTRCGDALRRAQIGEHRCDMFLSGFPLNENYSVGKKPEQVTQQEFFKGVNYEQ